MKCVSQKGESVKFEEGFLPFAQALPSPPLGNYRFAHQSEIFKDLHTKKPRQTNWPGLLDLATLSFVSLEILLRGVIYVSAHRMFVTGQ